MESGDYESAMADIDEVAGLCKRGCMVNDIKGLLYYKLGKYNDAVAAFSIAIENNPEFAVLLGSRFMASVKSSKAPFRSPNIFLVIPLV